MRLKSFILRAPGIFVLLVLFQMSLLWMVRDTQTRAGRARNACAAHPDHADNERAEPRTTRSIDTITMATTSCGVERGL